LGSFSLGVVVDSINCVLSPNPADISEKPEIQSTSSTEYITGVFKTQDKLIVFLDITRALSPSDHKAISQAGQGKKAA
jgi:purine-binding chemotaxis protein CheW